MRYEIINNCLETHHCDSSVRSSDVNQAATVLCVLPRQVRVHFQQQLQRGHLVATGGAVDRCVAPRKAVIDIKSACQLASCCGMPHHGNITKVLVAGQI